MPNIEIFDEPTYTFGSSDHSRRYRFEMDLSGGYRHNSAHGVVVDGRPEAVYGASGGATRPHSNAFLELDNRCYLAVGPFVVCFDAEPFKHHWALEVDQATCFGVHRCEDSGALVSHGELEISRFTESGDILWSAAGADIFSEGFRLCAGIAEAIDFNGKIYRFDLSDGHERI